jgi:phosphoribosylformimino-5-aminoimidazole carboxamide ribotide isomerase
MIVIPSVELRHGSCVQPSSEANGSGSGSPLGNAIGVVRGWANVGFRRIHLIDSDALAGTGSNASIVEDIIRDGALEVETCDSAESSDHIEQLIDAGALRVVLGPRALNEPEWLAGACELFPGLLVVRTDVRERRVVTRGWVRSLPHDILDVASELNGLSLGGLLISSMPAEPARSGADLSLIEDIVDACGFPVLVAGGVSSMNDLRALEHRGVSAVILGDPLYTGVIDAHNAAMEFDE